MSHWFHRNPIKASLPIEFEKRSFPSSSDAHLVCSLLKQNRASLLQLHSDPSNGLEAVQTVFKSYISLLLGFMNDTSGRAYGESKLRYTFKARWTQSLSSTSTL